MRMDFKKRGDPSPSWPCDKLPIRSSTSNRWNMCGGRAMEEQRSKGEKPKGSVCGIACCARFPVGRSPTDPCRHPSARSSLFFFFFILFLRPSFCLCVIIYYLVFFFFFFSFFFSFLRLIDIGHHHAVHLPVGRSSIKLQFPSGSLHSPHLKTVFCNAPGLPEKNRTSDGSQKRKANKQGAWHRYPQSFACILKIPLQLPSD